MLIVSLRWLTPHFKYIFITTIIKKNIFQLLFNCRHKNSFTCDYYDISMNFIKLIGNYIAISLTYLFNKCITIGYFPNCLKMPKL